MIVRGKGMKWNRENCKAMLRHANRVHPNLTTKEQRDMIRFLNISRSVCGVTTRSDYSITE